MAAWTPGEWRAFVDFVRRPALPGRATGLRLGALGAVLRLFALDLLLMAAMIGLFALAKGFGLELPESALEDLDLGFVWLTVIVLVAPLMEELLFRSWLSGRPGHVGAAAALLVGIALPVVSGPGAHPVLVFGSYGIALALAIGLAFWLRRRGPMPFFARHFAWFYAASALLFASAHLLNYSEGTAVFLLPLIVPQLLAGLIFGYARVTYGLWSDVLLHMLHNGLFIGLVVLGKGF